MMQIELNKICHRYKIKPSELDRENLEQYPADAQPKLSLAITCVSNAERTLGDFLDFLKSEKYKEWNDDQIAKREALLKSMIGKQIQYIRVISNFSIGSTSFRVRYLGTL